jgi:hypothetical protein
MDIEANVQANNDGELSPIVRRRGRPPGIPKTPGSGRAKGVPNRATRDVRAAAQKYSVKALRTLVKGLDDKDPRIAMMAANSILDRAHGKPMTPTEVTGAGGVPLLNEFPNTREGNLKLAHLVTYTLARASKDIGAEIAAGARPNVAPIRSGGVATLPPDYRPRFPDTADAG